MWGECKPLPPASRAIGIILTGHHTAEPATRLIADAQIHLWSNGAPAAHHRQTPFLKDEALAAMDAAGVNQAVIHPVMWDPDSNELAVEAACAHPERFAIMGWVYLDTSDGRATQESGLGGRCRNRTAASMPEICYTAICKP